MPSRIAASGSGHLWSNDAGGSFAISSDNRDGGAQARYAGQPTTANGKWHVCRCLLQTSDGYYAVKSDSTGTERVYKLEISK